MPLPAYRPQFIEVPGRGQGGTFPNPPPDIGCNPSDPTCTFPPVGGLGGPGGINLGPNPLPGTPAPQGEDIINITNQFTAQNNIDTGPIGDAINSGISGVVDAINQTATNVATTLSGTVNQFSNSLFQWAESIGKWIVQHIESVLQTIGRALKDITSSVVNAITNAVSGAIKALSDVVGPILKTVEEDITKVVDFYKDTIAPIINAVQQTIAAIAATEKAIQADLHAGIEGLLNLPTDIANGLQQIDQALIRAGRALQVKRKEDANVYFYGDEPGSFAAHIKSLGTAVVGLAGKRDTTTFSPGTETLSEPTLAEELPKLLDAMNTILLDTAKGLKNAFSDPKKALEILGITGVGIFFEWLEPIELLFMLFEILKAPLEVVGELAAERVREITQLRKLDPGTLTEAWLRKFITLENMNEEMRVQGYSNARSDIFRKLATYVEPDQRLVDYWYRRVIAGDDLVSGLKDLGYTDEQIDALKQGSQHLLTVEEAITAWRRNEMDDIAFNAVLTANRFTEDQRTLIMALALAPPGYSTTYNFTRQYRFLADASLAIPTFDSIPQPLRDAGRADGLGPGEILGRWIGSIDTLSASQWLVLYFRGFASQRQVTEALFRDRVPEELWQQWIDSQRPLIPFRTIPGMVKAGVISKSTALQKLQAHGYTLEDATLLLDYATTASKGTKAATAATQHEVSVATAKTLFTDGALTEAQYREILKEHGFSQDAIDLDVQLATIQEQVAARKTVGADIVATFQSGQIDETTALRQLSQSGLTAGEQAKFAKQLRSAKATKGKLPNEAELRAMAVKGVISVDDYTSNLVAVGFSQFWAQAFTSLHFPPATAEAAPATSGG